MEQKEVNAHQIHEFLTKHIFSEREKGHEAEHREAESQMMLDYLMKFYGLKLILEQMIVNLDNCKTFYDELDGRDNDYLMTAIKNLEKTLSEYNARYDNEED